ncbi:hypothetical protein [Foetidibacter luteolus]|uniref:hypothetical protein n=1 Tax=Foetidibacter luteolus TaxID=2608880 RepID=UPI00129A1FB8|nr:hypothetical protein [Foetidibacter luteolus]
MNKQLIAGGIALGAVAIGVAAYFFRRSKAEKLVDDVENAASDAHSTMNKHMRNIERKAARAFNNGVPA